MRAFTARSLAFLFLLTALNGCAWQTKLAPVSAPEERLVQLILRRLDLARHVAWIKYQNKLPIYDPKREQELLTSLVAQGVNEGLPAAEVEAFFSAQIRASRQVQTDLIHKWKRGATLPPFPPADLRRDIRPRLDAVSTDMLRELVRLRKVAPPRDFTSIAHRAIRAKGYSWQTARFASAPLQSL